MNSYVDFSKQSLPPIYQRKNKDCYFDPIREKLIYITPEETVRQDNEKIILGEKDSKEEAMLLGNEMTHQYKNDDGVISCIVIDVDDNGNQIGNSYQLLHTWL